MKFYKLNAALPPVDISRLQGEFFEGYGPGFKSYSIKDQDYLTEVINSLMHFDLKPDVISYTEIHPDQNPYPHADQCQTALNFYIDPGDCALVFFEKTHNDSSRKIDRDVNNNDHSIAKEVEVYLYDQQFLRYHSHMIPQANEVYLLNTKEIHLIKRITLGTQISMRKIIRCAWDLYPIEQVLASITLK